MIADRMSTAASSGLDPSRSWRTICESCVSSNSRTPPRSSDALAQAESERIQGDIDVNGRRLHGEPISFASRVRAPFGHTHDHVIICAALDRLADRVVLGEEGLGRTRDDHGVVLMLRIIFGRQESAAVDLKPGESGILVRRANDIAIEGTIVVANRLEISRIGRARMIIGTFASEAIKIVVLQSVTEDSAGLVPLDVRPDRRESHAV